MLVGRVGRRGAWLKGAGSLDDLESTHPATQQVLFARHCAIKKMLEHNYGNLSTVWWTLF